MKKYLNNVLVKSTMLSLITINVLASAETLEDVTVSETVFDTYVKSVTSEKLENMQASDIKDILKTMPSVIVDGNARYGQKVYIRGLEDKFSNITIDGAKISGQLFHHSGDQTIDADMLKIGSIELGPNSALSGAGVVNGSFVYETKDPSDFLKDGESFGARVTTGYQSGYERKSGSIAVFSKINDKLEFLGIGNIAKDGALNIPKREKVTSKESTLKSGLVKFVFKPNDFNTFKLSYNKYQDGGNRQLSGEKPGSSTVSDPRNEVTRDTVSLDYNYVPDSELINIQAKTYFNSQKLIIDSLDDTDYWTGGDNADEPERTFENKSYGLDIRNSSLFENHKFTYGASYDITKQKLDTDGNRVYTSGANIGTEESISVDGGETKEYGFYLEDEIELDKFVFNLGARYDIYKLDGLYDGSYKELSPKFKMQYQATQNLKLRAGYGRIFKGPNLGETLMIEYGVSPDSDIKAQTGNNYELGFDYDLSNSLNANSNVGFTVYKYNLDNYMHPTKNTSLTNQSDVDVLGFETIFNYKKDDLGLNASYTYTKGDEQSISTGTNYEPTTANIHTLKLGLDYRLLPNLLMYYTAEFVRGNNYDSYYARADEVTDVRRSGYAVHDLNFTYTPENLKNAKINFGIDNIFDKKYSRHTSFGTNFGDDDYTSFEVGRNFKVKLTYSF